MQVMLVTDQPGVIADFRNWQHPGLVCKNTLTDLRDIIGAGQPGVLCVGPDLLRQGLPTLEPAIKLAIEAGWRLVVLSVEADASEIDKLYQLGVDDVMWWAEDRSDNYRQVATLLKRPVYRKQTGEAKEADILTQAGIVAWEFDTRNWRFAYISSNIEQVLGYAAEHWYRSNYSFKLVHPDDRQHVDAAFREAVLQAGVREVRSRMLGSGGRVVWTRTIINVDEPGPQAAPRVTGIILDVSAEHRHVQESIRKIEQSRTEIEQHLNRAPLAVMKTDENLAVTTWSPGAEAMLGRRFDEVQGRPWSELGLIHPEDESRVIAELLPLINGQVRYQEVRNRNLKKDGAVVHMHWVNSCLRNADGTLQSLLSMGRDVSAEVAMEKHRNQQARMDALVALSSGVAHDFNNLLTPVLLNAEQIQADTTLTRSVRARGEQIRKNAMRAREIIAALQHINKPLEPHTAAVNTRRFIDDLQAGFYAIPGHTTLLIDGSAAPAHFMADENMLFQALTNLFTNAIHVSEERQTPVRLQISCRNGQQPRLLLAVRDEGPGIPQNSLLDVFLPFFTTKRGGKGTGLGLAMVKQVCEAHGGEVELESDEGRGTEFRLVIPLVVASMAQIQQQEASSVVPAPARDSLRVALVEDEPVVLETLEAMLEELGHTSSSFPDGARALQALTANPQHYDLVISDQLMPVMTGLELAQQLSEQGFDIPIVLVTGTAEELMRQHNLPGNIKAILEKPMTYREFQSCLAALALGVGGKS